MDYSMILQYDDFLSDFQGGDISKHEGKSKVFHTDCPFLFPGICGHCIFVNIDRCMIVTLFSVVVLLFS